MLVSDFAILSNLTLTLKVFDKVFFKKIFEFTCNDNNNNQFQSKHFDFFDSFHDDKSVIIDAIMKFINENIVFRDVHLFMIKTKNFVVTKNENIVRRNFFQCLKNDVLNSYTSFFIDMKKNFLLLNQNLNQ